MNFFTFHELTLGEKIHDWYPRQSVYFVLQRDVQQLKKYWSNLKQLNKNILTSEKQSTFLTGGGPRLIIGEVDPDVLDVSPTLMTTAPTIASSNISTQESAGT